MTTIDYGYCFGYLHRNAIWIGEPFLAPIGYVFQNLPSEVLLEIANDAKTLDYLRTDPTRRSASGEELELAVCQPPVFIAPDPKFGGLVLDAKSLDDGFLVYLSPELLEGQPAEMEAIIAVQFANVLLQQEAYVSAVLAELCENNSATQLAESWGFQVQPNIDTAVSFSRGDTDSIGGEDSDVGELLHVASLLWVGSEYRGYLRNVFSRLPKNVLARLRELKPIFFAPERHVPACVMPTPDIDDFRWRVYLSPRRLRDASCNIERTIAHELAHVYREHPVFSGGNALEAGQEQEDEADRLATEWGFPG